MNNKIKEISKIRAFIAVPIDQTIRAGAGYIQEVLKKTGGDVKWVNTENLHLTLRFLGNIPEVNLQEYYKAVQKSVSFSSSFRISFQGLGVFPGFSRPRVLWIGIKQGKKEISQLAHNINTLLGQASLVDRDKKEKFSPHLTLGRVCSRRGQEKLMKVLKENIDCFGGEMEVTEIHFIKSTLTSKGPIYNTLKKFKLK